MSKKERDAFVVGVAYGDFMSMEGENWTEQYRNEVQAEALRRYPDAPSPAPEANP